MKKHIISAAISGIEFGWREVASVKRGSENRVLVLRHDWYRDDGRAIDAVMRAVRKAARDFARTHEKTVEIYTKQGDLLQVVEPE